MSDRSSDTTSRSPAGPEGNRGWVAAHIYACFAGLTLCGTIFAAVTIPGLGGDITKVWSTLSSAVAIILTFLVPVGLIAAPASALFHVLRQRARLRHPVWFMAYGGLVGTVVPVLTYLIISYPFIGTRGMLSREFPASWDGMALAGVSFACGVLGGWVYWWHTRPRPAGPSH